MPAGVIALRKRSVLIWMLGGCEVLSQVRADWPLAPRVDRARVGPRAVSLETANDPWLLHCDQCKGKVPTVSPLNVWLASVPTGKPEGTSRPSRDSTARRTERWRLGLAMGLPEVVELNPFRQRLPVPIVTGGQGTLQTLR